jgi:dihydroorotase
MRKLLLSLTLAVFATAQLWAQATKPYSIVIKGGTVMDPKNNINTLMDIAIADGKIAAVEKNIDASKAVQVVDAKGFIVTPGLIDLHAHVFIGGEIEKDLGGGTSSVWPDAHSFRSGVTTMVDAGGAGWKSFGLFKKNVIDRSQTRVLSLLNIVGEGMRGGHWEQDLNDMNAKRSADTALAYKNTIVGFKLAHFADEDWTPVDRVVQAGTLADMPVMIDFGGSADHAPMSIETLFMKKLRPGDIYTHVFTDLMRRDPVVDRASKQLRPFVLPAQKRGIIFDVGYGGGSFDYDQAIPSLKAGFFPNSLGTDIHMGSANAAMKNQLNVMSIHLAMGMSLPAVITASTWGPAKAIKQAELGHLSVGAPADVAVFNILKGNYGYFDRMGKKIQGKEKLECELTIRAGRIVYNLNGIATPIVVNPTK